MKLGRGPAGLRGFPLLGFVAVYCVVVGLVLSFGKTLGNSVDMGFHLQTTELLRDHLLIPRSAEAFQREMFAYPRWSYRLATPAVWAGLSSPNALGLAAAASIAATWLMLLAMARRISEAVLLMAFLCSAAIVLFLGAAIGAEVVINFFYPQLIGEPVAIGLVLVGAYLIERSRAAFAAFALVAVWIAGQFHLIPALHAAGGLGIVLLVDWARTPAAHRLRAAAWVLTLPAMGAVLVLNPAFAALRHLSIVDGGIRFAAPMGVGQVALGAAALLALSGAIVLHLLRRPGAIPARPAVVFFAAMGGATAAAALAQTGVFLWLGEGSPYAVKKHAFAVFTGLAFVAPVGLWLAATVSSPTFPPPWRPLLRILAALGLLAVGFALLRQAMALGPFVHLPIFDQLRVALAGATVAGLLLAAAYLVWAGQPRRDSAIGMASLVLVTHLSVLQLLLLRPGEIDTPRLSNLLEDTAALKAAQPDRTGYFFASSNPPPVVSFLVNMAALRMDRAADQNFAPMLVTGDVLFPELATNMITEVGDPTYDVTHCRRGPPRGSVVLVDGACAPQAVYEFGAGDSGKALLGAGWSVPEQGWTWSDGPRAEINVPLPPTLTTAEKPRLILRATGYTTAESPDRVVHIAVEGGESQTYTFNFHTSVERAFRVEIPSQAIRSGMARIVFTIDNPEIADPKAPRRLGIAVWRMVLYPNASQAVDRREDR